jgi:hypothetical protein
LANVLERLFIFDAGDAEEEHIMFQKSDVQLAVMEKQQRLGIIHGRPRILTEKECGRIGFYLFIAQIDSNLNLRGSI